MENRLFIEKNCLNDNQIIFLSELMKKKYGSDSSTFIICDSLHVNCYLTKSEPTLNDLFSPEGVERHEKNNIRLYIFEVFARDHWSLLIYYKDLNQFFAYDSLCMYHKCEAYAIKNILQRRKIFPEDNGADIVYPFWIPSQKSVWECGYYICVFMYILLEKGGNRPISRRDIDHIDHYLVSLKRFLALFKQLLSEESYESLHHSFATNQILTPTYGRKAFVDCQRVIFTESWNLIFAQLLPSS